MNRRRVRSIRPRAEGLDQRVLLSGLTPAQVVHAYGLDAITFANGTVKGDGSGQTIALVEAFHDPYLAADLRAFSSAYSLPEAQLSVVNLGATTSDDDWASESAMDVQWAHAVAPGAKILVVEAKSQSQSDLLAAVNVARSAPGVVAVSMSWGFKEFANEGQYDSYFTTPIGHQGVTFFAASGDSGIWGGAEWPSASPNVVSVGGTTLNLDGSGAIASETAWINGGGGLSSVELEPAYQRSVQTSGRRSTPDVAFLANPDLGVSVYYTTPSTGHASWVMMGGTSLGTPAWAGIIAIVDQGLSLAGKSSLDGATQTLPSLYALASGHWGDFHSVASTTAIGGNSDPNAANSTTFTTGLGSPNGLKLVTDLVATSFATANPGGTNATTPPTSTAPPTTTTTTSGTTTKKHKKRHAPPKKKAKVVAHKKKPAKVTHAIIDAALASWGE